VSYAGKHNEANGEQNHDGMSENYSANYGVEGPTENADIQRLRRRQMKNFIATLMLSRGVPMLLGGMNSAAVKTATTMPIVRTMKLPGMTGNGCKPMANYTTSPGI